MKLTGENKMQAYCIFVSGVRALPERVVFRDFGRSLLPSWKEPPGLHRPHPAFLLYFLRWVEVYVGALMSIYRINILYEFFLDTS